jgi:hypothetical protein
MVFLNGTVPLLPWRTIYINQFRGFAQKVASTGDALGEWRFAQKVVSLLSSSYPERWEDYQQSIVNHLYLMRF